MTEMKTPAAEKAWAAIEQEKRRDRFLKRMSTVAWTVTVLMLLLYGGMVAGQLSNVLQMMDAGAASSLLFYGALTPLVVVVGLLSVLVATLCTIGMFMRMRAASLAEIQLRLAALEDMIARDRS